MRPVKAALQPLYDELKSQMPIAQQQASPALKALQNIVEGDDYAPLSTADQNLSAIKSIQRTAPNAKTAYLANKAINEVSGAVDQAAADAGPVAVQALQDGRALTRAKYATQDTLDNLQTEPVRLFRQLTTNGDQNINLLRDVASKTPDALPAVGRAYVQGLLDDAFGEAGTAKPGTALTNWNKLGDQTKHLLFGNPQIVKNLDNFFTLAKKASENPNPSGTATVGELGLDGAFLLHSPHLAIPYVIGKAGLARLLYSKAGAEALANGLRVPLRNPSAAALAADQILKLAGPDARPIGAASQNQ
jgi:hypothetical protein